MPENPIRQKLAVGASLETTIYTAPSDVVAVSVSSLHVCNRTNATRRFRAGIDASGTPLTNDDYIAYDTPIEAYSYVPITEGIMLKPGDKLIVWGNAAALTFHLWGVEIR